MVSARVIHPDSLLTNLLVDMLEIPIASAGSDEVRPGACDFRPSVVATRGCASERWRFREAKREELLAIHDQRSRRSIDHYRHRETIPTDDDADASGDRLDSLAGSVPCLKGAIIRVAPHAAAW